MMQASEFHRRMAEVEKPNAALAALPPLIRNQPQDAAEKHRAFMERIPVRSRAEVQGLLANRYQLMFDVDDNKKPFFCGPVTSQPGYCERLEKELSEQPNFYDQPNLPAKHDSQPYRPQG